MLGTAIDPLTPIRTRLAPGLILVLMLMALCAHPVQAGARPPSAEMPRAQRHESRHEIDRLEEKWRDAVLNQNSAAMDSLLADDYMAITASGTLQTKQEALANIRSGHMHLTTLDISDRKVRFYGKTALVTSLAQIEGTNAEGSISGSFRYTRVYVREAQGDWKIVSFEASRIREPGEHK